jgi:hypothetical protein
MNEARPFASLSSGLLARKGSARPAMRPQGFGPIGGYDDLGWNDMGPEPEGEMPEHVPSSISALTPAPKLVQPEEPEVVAQQRAIAETFAPDLADAEEAEFAPELEVEAAPELMAEAPESVPAKAPAEVVKLPKPPTPPAIAAPGRKAAFTLRVDPDRHLRLRLATAVTGRSAQQIVTEALDRFLAAIPEVEALAERVPASGSRTS